jgi:PAS domain-containing protein
MIDAAKGTRDQFRAWLEAAPDAMVIVDQSGRIVLVNSQTENLFGFSREELLGKPMEFLIPKRFHDKHPSHRDVTLATRTCAPWARGCSFSACARTVRRWPASWRAQVAIPVAGSRGAQGI